MTRWPSRTIEDICFVNPRLPRDHQIADGTSVSFVPMAAVDEVAGAIVDPQVRAFSEVKKGYTHFTDSDVLFAKITPCMENGKAAIASNLVGGIGFGSTEFHVLRSKGEVLPAWLFYFVRQPSFRSEAKRNFTGTAGQQRVPTTFLARAAIPVPPLPEQRRIVDLLSRAEGIVRLRREAEKKAAELIPALFIDMFGDPGTNPKGFEHLPLGDVIKVKSGEFLPAEKMKSEGDIPVYGGNGIAGRHTEAMFAEQQVVVGRVGAYCGNVHLTKERCWVTDNALYVADRFRPLRNIYLAIALRLMRLNQYSSQAGQPLISAGRIYPAKIPVPNEASQRRFEDAYLAIESVLSQQSFATAKAHAAFDALLGRAFGT